MTNQPNQPGHDRKTSTLEMYALAKKPDLTVMAEVCQKLELLNIAACRTHAIWAGENSLFTTEDRAKFLNNVPGPIAVFKAMEEQLLDEGLFTTQAADLRIREILHSMCEMVLPEDEAIEADPMVLPRYFKSYPRDAHRLLFANTTWMTQLYNQVGKDGEPYAKISKANSFIQLLSPDEGDSDEERIKRQMLIKLDLQQICVSATWWLDVLQDSDKLVHELKQIQALREKFDGPAASDLMPAERLQIGDPMISPMVLGSLIS